MTSKWRYCKPTQKIDPIRTKNRIALPQMPKANLLDFNITLRFGWPSMTHNLWVTYLSGKSVIPISRKPDLVYYVIKIIRNWKMASYKLRNEILRKNGLSNWWRNDGLIDNFGKRLSVFSTIESPPSSDGNSYLNCVGYNMWLIQKLL